MISSAGGATGVFRPHAVGEGLGRIWYAPWNTGSAYSLAIKAGAKMTQMEHRLVVTRFKDGYGPVGMWFLLFKGKVKNAYGELYEHTQEKAIAPYAPYDKVRPIPTPLRNHQMLTDRAEGRGPHYMRTDEALQALTMGLDPKAVREIESDAWEDFLDMTMSQALLWASNNIDPAKVPSELTLTEPYLMGSHSSATGAWVSGPEDLAREGYFWGYNRMTTVPGLFAAGDGVGGSAHKFSSGSYTEGRLAAKGAISFISDNDGDRPGHDEGRVQAIVDELYAPYRVFEESAGTSTQAGHQPRLLLSEAGAAPAAEDHGRVLRRGRRQLHHQRADPQPRHGADAGLQGGHGQGGGARPPRAAALLGAARPDLVRRGAHAPHPPPRGDPLAGLLLPHGPSQDRRRELAGVRQLPHDAANGEWEMSTHPCHTLVP